MDQVVIPPSHAFHHMTSINSSDDPPQLKKSVLKFKFYCPKKGLPKHFYRVPCCMMILTLSRITNSAILITLTIKHICIYIEYCPNALLHKRFVLLFYFNNCQLICTPYDILNVRHLLQSKNMKS